MENRKRSLILLAGLAVLFVLSGRAMAFEDPVLAEEKFLSDLRSDEETTVTPFLRVAAGSDGAEARNTSEPARGTALESAGAGAEEEDIADPMEGLNRAFFEFNDKLYFWLLKPVSTGYKAVVPEPARVGIKNFFHNVLFPVRFVNCLLQGKVEGAVNEFGRFLGNSVFGLAGFLDVIPEDSDMKRQDEDLGQTLGSWGLGPGFYMVLPFAGPSSLRDTFGMVGDGFLDPTYYLVPHVEYDVAIKAHDRVNDTSLRIGDYESLKKASLDPYVALRNAYHQHRRSKIAE
jgi:phospholipid-binding lipoprotein MlaA